MSGQSVFALDTTVVQLVTDSGVSGWGETCPVGPLYQPSHAKGAVAALQEIGPAMTGCRVLPLIVQRQMASALHGHAYAKSAIDIAVHDALGKHLGLPVCDLLGGAVSDRMPSYFATGIGDPDDIARLTSEKVQEGYPRIQIKAGGRPVEMDIETVRRVWEKVSGRCRIAVDANRGLKARDAILLSHACSDIPFVLEQPCSTIEETRSLRGQICHPIYLDESTVDLNTVITVAGEGLCDGFGMKVSRMGGLSGMAAFRAIAEARSLPHTCDDSWGGDIVAAACAHIGATIRPDLLEGVWMSTPYIEGSYCPETPVTVTEGHVRLPEGIGSGISPNPSVFGAPVSSFGA